MLPECRHVNRASSTDLGCVGTRLNQPPPRLSQRMQAIVDIFH